ncbi:MAG: site-specific integrase [Rhodospirillales bacterium]|nr:site-specific integrase [Rhodospirillales bacterium]MDH3920934.1 site-specific integrase [Rhodospirillales bacterium]
MTAVVSNSNDTPSTPAPVEPSSASVADAMASDPALRDGRHVGKAVSTGIAHVTPSNSFDDEARARTPHPVELCKVGVPLRVRFDRHGLSRFASGVRCRADETGRNVRLSKRTIRHAHGVLRTALSHAAAVEIVERNVASIIKPPKAEETSVAILTADQIADTLAQLKGHSLYPIAALAIGTGARRGEIAALRWSDIDLDAATVRIERSLEQTKAGLRAKSPKTAAGRRTISLPAFAVAALRDHRRAQLELRLAAGAGAMPADLPVFGDLDGAWPNPYSISDRWRDAVKTRKLPKVTFHALRHSHASALIAAGLDIVSISSRLGHASPALTLAVYSHLFTNNDVKAAAALDNAFAK